jgi:hypothetical protein
MKHPRILHALIQTAVMAAVLCLPVAWAQQSPDTSPSTDSGGPIQPLAPLPNGSDANAVADPLGEPAVQGDAPPQVSPQPQPDTHPLSGAQTLGLGSLPRLQRIFDPSLEISEFGQTGIQPRQTLSVSSLGGRLDVDQRWGRSDLMVAYHGAETFYQPYSYYGLHKLPYQDVTLSQEILAGRWKLQLRDDLLYSWGPGFGSLFAGGPAQAGQSALSSVQPSLASTGTIQTNLAKQLSNSSVVEIDYERSRRTTLTVLGSYGLLHFLDPGYINNQDIIGRLGYNYALSGKNIIALSYERNHITFIGANFRLQTDLAQIMFARKATGRLAFQVSAGPQLLHLDYIGSAQRQQLSWSASSSLTYQWRRTGYSLSYFRGVTAGSGVLLGSTSQTATATVNHEFTRMLSASVNGGYAMNNGLVSTPGFASRFDNWFAGANLNRLIGRQVRLGLSYAFEQQTSGAGTCPVLSCSLPRPFSQYGVTFQWHPLVRSGSERTAGSAPRPSP